MTTPPDRDPAAVQRVIDVIVARHDELTPGEIRTALAAGLSSIGVHVPPATLQTWSDAIVHGRRVRAETDRSRWRS